MTYEDELKAKEINRDLLKQYAADPALGGEVNKQRIIGFYTQLFVVAPSELTTEERE